MKKTLKLFTTLLLTSLLFINNVFAVYTDSSVGTYEAELAKFPAPYQEKIKKLHEIYPNAIFVAQNKFFDWDKEKEIEISWAKMLEAQKKPNWSLTETSSGWKQASEEQIIYYLNPYNFIDETHIFMFESQFYYKDHQNIDGVKNLLKGTFMEEKKCEGSEKTYAEVIMELAEQYNVSPYMIASRIKQEQGTKGSSPLISGSYKGYEGYYNYFNIQASGNSDAETIENGLKCAKGELYRSNDNYNLCKGNNWNSPYESIKGGVKFIRKSYIGINDTYNVKGQMTNYLQKWDPYGPNLGGHQYMQNIAAPYYEAESTLKSYKSKTDYKSYGFVFYIPIYKGAPNLNLVTPEVKVDTTEIADKISTKYNINSVFISGLQLGLSHNDLVNNIKSIDTNLNSQIITDPNANISGKVATGDIIRITLGNVTQAYALVVYGDVNGDGQINSADLLRVRQHLIGSIKLTGNNFAASDINNDGQINSADLLKVRQHLIGTIKIS